MGAALESGSPGSTSCVATAYFISKRTRGRCPARVDEARASSRYRLYCSTFFVIAVFIWKMTAVNSQSVNSAKQWIGRIVIGTIGVEMAGTLVQILTSSLGTNH